MLKDTLPNQPVQTQGVAHRTVSIIIAPKVPHVTALVVGVDIIASPICHQAVGLVICITHMKGIV